MKKPLLFFFTLLALVSSCGNNDDQTIFNSSEERSPDVFKVFDKGTTVVRGKGYPKDQYYYGKVYLMRSSSQYFIDKKKTGKKDSLKILNYE